MLPFLWTYFCLFIGLSYAYHVRRDAKPVCTDLRASSNNGDRKIAIVIDSSGSMAGSDPYDLRLSAGRQALDWLISQKESTGTQKKDLVTIINFDDQAYLDYALGDPGGAGSAFDSIGATGGTYIAGGVEMAIDQLTKGGSGDTAGRSGILVFTDGADSSTSVLVDKINSAASLGIRVAFGFLDSSSSTQDPEVLSAIMHSGGRYFTIPDYNASLAFINGIIVNGLTKNDNPQGDTTTLLSGLDASHFISGSETQTMSYTARSKERLTFSITSLNAGTLSVKVAAGSKVLATGKTGYSSSQLPVVAPGDGKIDVQVTASNAPKDSIFIVGVSSNLPPLNCTVGIGPPPKKSNTTKIVAPTVSIGAILLLTAGGYFLYKWYYPKTPTGPGPVTYGQPPYAPGAEKALPVTTVSAIPPAASVPLSTIPPGTQKLPWFKFPPVAPPPPKNPPPRQDQADKSVDHSNPEDSGSDFTDISDIEDNTEQNLSQDAGQQKPSHHRRIVRIRTYGNNHHHHLDFNHPCAIKTCALASETHVCEDPNHMCTCVDPKCKLNSRRHRCNNDNFRHICAGPKYNTMCPLRDPEYADRKKKEHDALVRKYMAQDLAKKGVKMAAKHVLRATTGIPI